MAQGEYLTNISGTIRVYGGSSVVSSIQLDTNITTYGPYGLRGNTGFGFNMTGAEIRGFYGAGGYFIDSIGMIVTLADA